MPISLGVGTQVAIATGYDAADIFSAITNASPAVMTLSSGHGLVNADFVEVNSNWDLLNGRIARITGSATTAASLEGIDTSSTTLYPAGGGVGNVRRITGWTPIPLLADPTLNGGEQQFVDVPELAKQRTGKLPGEVSAIDLSMPVYYEALPSAGVARVIAVQAAGLPVAIRITHPSGDVIVANGYWSIRRFPSISRTAARLSQITFSQLAVDETIYAT